MKLDEKTYLESTLLGEKSTRVCRQEEDVKVSKYRGIHRRKEVHHGSSELASVSKGQQNSKS